MGSSEQMKPSESLITTKTSGVPWPLHSLTNLHGGSHARQSAQLKLRRQSAPGHSAQSSIMAHQQMRLPRPAMASCLFGARSGNSAGGGVSAPGGFRKMQTLLACKAWQVSTRCPPRSTARSWRDLSIDKACSSADDGLCIC